ncbi:omptin family outer membrane protease [Rahnella sp. SAP-1]|uniref:Omptin family outer membrane protease n=1 Tax=Rouxiella aceris TaxID=2703884 RepID=A0A848MK89_9GAMM|nr:omptin family outer membrane protease [Rouxiella aceris]NMP27521.1 omptin family outer membrane protease [Rouxiella aceris]
MRKYQLIAGLCAVLSVNVAMAKNNISLSADNITMNTSLGWLGGESKEYVYDPEDGRKISQLDWKIKNTAIIKGDISWNALDWLTLNARGWTTLASGSAGMDDYDWSNPGQSHWTDWSTHPRTRLNYANEFDVNIKGWVLAHPYYRLGGVLGYQQTRFSWTAHGGDYQYDNGNIVGSFPDNLSVIGYQQTFSAPYIGLVGMYRYRNFEFNALLKFSAWVQAKDNDEHYRRSLTFRENTYRSRYYSVTLDAGYYVTPNAKVFTELSLSQYTQGKGGIHMINQQSGESQYLGGDAAGIANKNYSITAGLQYRF